MIATLLFTMLVEGLLALAYSIWRKKPIAPILLTTIFANLLTQFLLWVGLHLLFEHYLPTLFIAEILIWMLESILLYQVRANKLELWEAIRLSLVMNLASFGLGWFLPI